MAAAPINNSERRSDLHRAVNDRKTPNSPEITDVTIAQYLMSKTSPPAPLTPSSQLSGKRKRLKPAIISVKKRSPLKDKALHDPSRTRLRKEKATKDSNTPVKISQTMIRAREIQSTLGNEHPSFIKTMLRSHVTIGFWLGLPLRFCRSFLPKDDSLMVSEDENGELCNLKFLAEKCGFSGGWRKFAIGHKLREGDVLIFQLVESCKFKVYIVRTNDSEEVDGAVNVTNHDAHAGTPATVKRYSKPKGRKHLTSTSLPIAMAKKKHKRSEPNLSLKELKTFKDFHIMVNKRCIDSELSEETRMNYYNLCCGKNEILHDGVREGLNDKLVAGMIDETVNIANMIKNCKLTTRKEEFDVWDDSLKSFKLIGMKVGFLRDRIHALANLAFESEDAKRYLEAKEERKRNAQEIKILEAKLVELYESNQKIDGVVDGLKERAERYEIEFQKKVDAPW